MIAQAIRVVNADLEPNLAAVTLFSLFGLTLSCALAHIVTLTAGM